MSPARCGCCMKLAPAGVSSIRGWCFDCEQEFARVICYLEALTKMLRYAVAKSHG